MYYVAEKKHGQPSTREQARIVSMLVYDQPEKFDNAVKRVITGKNAIPAVGPNTALGKRMASLQPFNDNAVLSSTNPRLAGMMGVKVPRPLVTHAYRSLRCWLRRQGSENRAG